MSGAALGPTQTYVASGDAKLHTAVRRAATPEAAGTVVIRTPYSVAAHDAEAAGWQRHGYHVVIQDVRGRHGSSGVWNPYSSERDDADATAQWLREEGFTGGGVVCVGASYGAHCALHMVDALGGDAAAVIVAVPALSLAHVAREPSGHPRWYGHAWWWFQHGVGKHSKATDLHDYEGARAGVLTRLPAVDLASACAGGEPSFADAWRRDGECTSAGDPSRRITDAYPFLSSSGDGPLPPLLVIAGQHDPFAADAWELEQTWSGGADIILGPWQHDLGLVNRDRNGVLPLDPAHRTPPGALMTRWLAGRLPEPGQRTATVGIQGTSQWMSPSGGGAAQARWVLRPTVTSFTADPLDPHTAALGPVDAGEILARTDHADYQVTLEQDVCVCGPVTVQVRGHRVRRDADDLPGPHDLGVLLIWCADDQTPVVLAQTMVRCADTAQVTLPPVGALLRAGGVLRVVLTGHLFGVFAREPHTGDDPLTAVDLRPAQRDVGSVAVSCPTADARDAQSHPLTWKER